MKAVSFHRQRILHSLLCLIQYPNSCILSECKTNIRAGFRYSLYIGHRGDTGVRSSTTFVSAGFYFANTVSLSFGTLAVNDVVAAGVTVAFCEVLPAQCCPVLCGQWLPDPSDRPLPGSRLHVLAGCLALSLSLPACGRAMTALTKTRKTIPSLEAMALMLSYQVKRQRKL